MGPTTASTGATAFDSMSDCIMQVMVIRLAYLNTSGSFHRELTWWG